MPHFRRKASGEKGASEKDVTSEKSGATKKPHARARDRHDPRRAYPSCPPTGSSTVNVVRPASLAAEMLPP